MKKGSYTLLIGAGALLVLATLITMNSMTQTLNDTSAYSSIILESKKQVFSTKILLDRTTSDAILDHAEPNGCNVNSNVSNMITQYYDNVINDLKEQGVNCNYSGLNVSPGATVNVLYNVSCSTNLGEKLDVFYEETANSRKSVSGNCNVTDVFSGETEASR